MSEKLTPEQSAAIAARGKVIVSASAGSGKTFVMIKKIADLIESGGDTDEILAVTFTKKAAAQMKDKLRSELIARLTSCDGEKRERLKAQLSKIPSADICTIHSFCSRLLRTYFYALGIDSSFDIISADDAEAARFLNRAADNFFDRTYEEGDADFLLVLSCLKRKRSDDSVRRLIFETYSEVRIIADYEEKLARSSELFTKEGFDEVCAEYKKEASAKFLSLLSAVDKFELTFPCTAVTQPYFAILDEMRTALKEAADCDLFAPLPKLHTTAKPRKKKETEEADAVFTEFRDGIKRKYEAVLCDISDEETEYKAFIKSGALATAFSRLLLAFDREYSEVKRDEGKLDYNDLEHLTLRLLKDSDIKSRINAKYKHVFVDEYQDVNPVQERIIAEVGAKNVFTVGDVKQAIYGFRGSKSAFFSKKYDAMSTGAGSALKLTSNFRSADKIIDFVNRLFSASMTEKVCGFDYKGGSEMTRGGAYPEGYGSAEILVFGKEEKEAEVAEGIYSVAERALVKSGHTRESLAVLDIVRRELGSTHYDLKEKDFVPTRAGDICILTRKRSNAAAAGIVRALTDAGYSVAGAKDVNICGRAEIREMLDILSFIDNSQQDLPLITALTSPLGALSREELATIRIAMPRVSGVKNTYRECAVWYATNRSDGLAYKLAAFYKKIYSLRKLSDVLGAAQLIYRIADDCGFTAKYSAGNGEKLLALRRLAEEARSGNGELSLNAFLAKIRAGGYRITAPAGSASDSIKVMTMHASKGLEFPVVIIADAAASFKGMEYSDMPFDEKYGFAPHCYDIEEHIKTKTLLRAVCAVRKKREELKNELNLFYVACTRAMCRLYITCSEIKPYSESDAFDADNYLKLCDFSSFTPSYMPELSDFTPETAAVAAYGGEADEKIYAEIKSRFLKPYGRAASVELPVKSSASQILRSQEESYFAERVLFTEEGETGIEAGLAYHKFLELCDFSVKDEEGINREIESFLTEGTMSEDAASALDCGRLATILSMPVFAGLEGAQVYREQEFLCRLPANAFLDTDADDKVLVQGAIDLLAVTRGGARIIDYKYSKKTDDELIKKYSPQLALYKKAVSAVLKINEKNISATIVNIFAGRQINL